MELENIGRFIAKLRKEKELTQKDLGEIIKVDSKTISKWEQGKNAPDITILKKLSEIFEVSIDELLSGKKNVEPITKTNVYIIIIDSHQKKE